MKDPKDLQTLFTERERDREGLRQQITTMKSIWHGEIPAGFHDYFHPDTNRHILNFIRLAWGDLKNLAAKEFQVFIDPRKNSNAAHERAEKAEAACYAYGDHGLRCQGVDYKGLMNVLAWQICGFDVATGVVMADFENKMPFFSWRDPESHYPPIGYSPWKNPVLKDTMFVYDMKLGALCAQYPHLNGEIRGKYLSNIFGYGQTKRTEDSEVKVCEYYSDECWYLFILDDPGLVLFRSDEGDKNHPGVCPVVEFQASPGTSPRSMFADQVGLQVAMSRLLSQGIDYHDQLLYGPLFHTPLVGGDAETGPGATNQYDPQFQGTPKAERLSPATSIEADRNIQMLMAISRVLNRNPENMQGAGEANSAKAINELMKGLNSTVQDGIWPAMEMSLPILFRKAAQMDINLWGNQKKSIYGDKPQRTKGQRSYDVTYIPNVDVRPFVTDIKVERGIGLGGYQGFLEGLQRLGAKVISRKTFFEQFSDYKDPVNEERRVQLDQLEEVMWQKLIAQDQSGQLRMTAFADIKKGVEDGKNIFDVVQELDKKGNLMAPPPEEMTGAPAGMPDLSSMLGGLEGAAPPSELPPEMAI